VVTATATGAIAAIEAEKYLAELDNRAYTEWADYI
jgi:thioredoxin reductase